MNAVFAGLLFVTLAQAGQAQKPPPNRGPVATGTVVDSTGKPAGGTRISYRQIYRDGGSTASSVLADIDGNFSIPHKRESDFQPVSDVIAGEVWAEREGEVSRVYEIPAAGALRIELQPISTVTGTVVGGSNAAIAAHVLSPTSTPRRRHVIWSTTVSAKDGAFDLGYVPAGRLYVRATEGERVGFAYVEIDPGSKRSVPVTIGRRGGLLVIVARDGRGGRLTGVLTPGNGYEDYRRNVLQITRGQPLEVTDLMPGVHTLTLVDDNGFDVSHEVLVESGTRWQITLPFVVQLPKGKVGLLLDPKASVVRVARVVPGGPADVAGLRAGDVIDLVDGVRPTSMQNPISLLGGAPGTIVTVDVKRGTRIHTFQITRSQGL